MRGVTARSNSSQSGSQPRSCRSRNVRTVGAEAARDAGHLHVVRHLHRDLVARPQLAQRDQVVRFRRAVGHLDVIDAASGIERGQPLAQLDRAVRLAVAERLIEEFVEIESHLDQLAQRERPHAALAHVVVDEVLPRRLHPLHLELFDHFCEVREALWRHVPAADDRRRSDPGRGWHGVEPPLSTAAVAAAPLGSATMRALAKIHSTARSDVGIVDRDDVIDELGARARTSGRRDAPASGHRRWSPSSPA